MERRDFIKTTCSLCVALGSGLLLGTLSSCASYPVYEAIVEKSKIIVPGSIFAKTNLQIIRAKNLDYDIALHKENDGSYSALFLKCTHASNPLKYTGSEFVCSLHGSTFDTEGKVTEGPATRALRRMDTTVSKDNITILID